MRGSFFGSPGFELAVWNEVDINLESKRLAKAGRAMLLLLALLSFASCIRPPKRRVDRVSISAYPSCSSDRTKVAESFLRAAPDALEATVREHFQLFRSSCGLVTVEAQEWSRGSTEVEAIFDANDHPIRVFKRSTAPGVQPVNMRTDLRVYDLTGSTAVMRSRFAREALASYEIPGPKPTALVAPGRSGLAVWIRRARLGVGEKTREWVLDIRDRVERIRQVTLWRQPDQSVDGKQRRVYTIFGREPIFVDEEGLVVGDMMGLRECPPFAIESVRAGQFDPSRTVD